MTIYCLFYKYVNERFVKKYIEKCWVRTVIHRQLCK